MPLCKRNKKFDITSKIYEIVLTKREIFGIIYLRKTKQEGVRWQYRW